MITVKIFAASGKTISNQSGFSLIEAMAVLAILGFFATGLATLITSANVQTGRWNTRIILENTILRLMSCADNSIAWQNTVLNSPSLECLRTPIGDCGPMLGKVDSMVGIRSDIAGTMCLDDAPGKPNPYNALVPTNGLTATGEFCNTYGQAGSNCPYRINSTWQPEACPPAIIARCSNPNVALKYTVEAFGDQSFNIVRTQHRGAKNSNDDWFIVYDQRPSNQAGGKCNNLNAWNRRKVTAATKQFIGEDVADRKSVV